MLYIIRGLPGSGKTTLGRRLCGVGGVYSADDFFYRDGDYVFDPTKLGEAHADCQRRVLQRLEDGVDVAVANTFTQPWEWAPYLEMAKKTGTKVTVISLFDQGLSLEELQKRGLHGVPMGTMRAMYERYVH